MALEINVGDKTIAVICSKDGSITIEDADEKSAAHDEYLKDLDESRLSLEGEPTRFIMRKVLPYSASKFIKNEQVSYTDGTPNVKMGFMLDEVRMSLVDIQNPGVDDLKYKKGSDGYTSTKLMETIESIGITTELYTARANAVQSADVGKKS